MSEKFKIVVDDERSAWVEDGISGTHIMICNNGYQSSGAAIGSLAVAKAAHEALGSWIAEKEEKASPKLYRRLQYLTDMMREEYPAIAQRNDELLAESRGEK